MGRRERGEEKKEREREGTRERVNSVGQIYSNFE